MLRYATSSSLRCNFIDICYSIVSSYTSVLHDLRVEIICNVYATARNLLIVVWMSYVTPCNIQLFVLTAEINICIIKYITTRYLEYNMKILFSDQLPNTLSDQLLTVIYVLSDQPPTIYIYIARSTTKSIIWSTIRNSGRNYQI